MRIIDGKSKRPETVKEPDYYRNRRPNEARFNFTSIIIEGSAFSEPGFRKANCFRKLFILIKLIGVESVNASDFLDAHNRLIYSPPEVVSLKYRDRT